MGFFQDVGRAISRTFSNPAAIIIPPLGIGAASFEIARPFIQQGANLFRSSIANQAMNPSAPQPANGMFQPAAPGVNYPVYGGNFSGSYLNPYGGSSWDSSTLPMTFSPEYQDPVYSQPAWSTWEDRWG